MAEKTPLPTHAQLKKLLEMLLPPDEEMDEASVAIILEQEGIDRSTSRDDLRTRLERRVEEQRARGENVSPDLLDVIASLQPGEDSEDLTTPDPEVWIDNLLNGAMPGNLTGSDQAQHLQSFRSRNMESLSPEDRQILEDLAAELQSELKEEED